MCRPCFAHIPTSTISHERLLPSFKHFAWPTFQGASPPFIDISIWKLNMKPIYISPSQFSLAILLQYQMKLKRKTDRTHKLTFHVRWWEAIHECLKPRHEQKKTPPPFYSYAMNVEKRTLFAALQLFFCPMTVRIFSQFSVRIIFPWKSWLQVSQVKS